MASQASEQLAPLGRIMGLSERQRQRHRRARLRGTQMNLGGPSPTGLANRLRPGFFRAPILSGWTCTIVLSSDTASSLIRTSRYFWRCSNIRLRIPFFDQRFIRV